MIEKLRLAHRVLEIKDRGLLQASGLHLFRCPRRQPQVLRRRAALRVWMSNSRAVRQKLASRKPR
jgi:hypothetical protein